jgi:hypothetical protein
MNVLARETSIAGGLGLRVKTYPAGLQAGRHEHGEGRYCLAIRGSYTDGWGRGYRTRAPHRANEMHTMAFHTDAACFHIEFTDSGASDCFGRRVLRSSRMSFCVDSRDCRVP